MQIKIVEVTPAIVEQALERVLEDATWPALAPHEGAFCRRHDDTDGETGREHEVRVDLGANGDVTITLDQMSPLVFLAEGGPHPSLRTRNAVILLAEAMRRDHLLRPQSSLTGLDSRMDVNFLAPAPEDLAKAIDGLLAGAYWPRSLNTDDVYVRRSDRAHGDAGFNQELMITFGSDFDAYIMPAFSMHSLRFREYMGGGMSLHTRNALLVLAEAVRRDNEASSQLV